jgi:hypothetical protein
MDLTVELQKIYDSEISANASKTQPAKLLAMIFAKKGSPQVMPA